MAKNIINEIPKGTFSSSSSNNTTNNFWYAPADGSRTNIMRLGAAAAEIDESDVGFGICLESLNDTVATLQENLTITDDDGEPLDVIRRRWTQQRDTEYLDFFYDDGATPYQKGALKILIKKPCWLHIEGTACTEKIQGSSATKTYGIGILRHNGTAWYGPPIAAATYTNEPAADGMALPLHSTHFYSAGTTIKLCIVSTWGTTILHIDNGGSQGLLFCETYFAITRIS